MERLGIAIYAACVDFLLRGAALLHITYRDANAALFFLVWPLVTLLLLALVLCQSLALRRARTGAAGARSPVQEPAQRGAASTL